MSWTKWSRQFGTKPTDGLKEPEHNSVSFVSYVNTVNERFRWYRHNQELAKVCQGILDGKLKRVIITIPPGTSKSEMISRLLSAAYLDRYPTREVGLVSYGADLAQSLAGDAREYFIAGGGKLDPSTSAKGNWKTLAGGGMWGNGFAGPIRGRRFHLGIVDDPHKGPEDLESEVLREKFHQWWSRTWLNRQNLFFEEGAAIVLVMQRLAENDLAGWLLSQPDADQWVVVALDAVRSEEPWQEVDAQGNSVGVIPMSCTVWPDWREPGELLCPELLGPERLKEQQADPDAYDAQFQQRPRPTSGTILDANKFILTEPNEVPALLRKVLGGDLALTEKETSDWTVGFPLGYGTNGHYYLFRPYREQAESPDTLKGMAARARSARVQAIGVESVAYQTSFVQHMRRDLTLAGIPILEVPADRDKVVRARGWSPLVVASVVHLVADPEHTLATGVDWRDVFLAEVKTFPRKKKDQIDAVGIAIAALREVMGPLSVPEVGGQHPGVGLKTA